MTEEKSFDAVVLTVGDELLTKSNGRPYVRCKVEFKSGPLVGKSYFAQRTLGISSKTGEEAKPVVEGQQVKCLLNFAVINGVKSPFFEITTSTVTSKEEIMDLLGE